LKFIIDNKIYIKLIESVISLKSIYILGDITSYDHLNHSQVSSMYSRNSKRGELAGVSWIVAISFRQSPERGGDWRKMIRSCNVIDVPELEKDPWWKFPRR